MLLLLRLISTSIKMSNIIRSERTWIRRYKSWRNFDAIEQRFLLIQFCANKLKQKFSTFEWRNENGNQWNWNRTESKWKNFLPSHPPTISIDSINAFEVYHTFSIENFPFLFGLNFREGKSKFLFGISSQPLWEPLSKLSFQTSPGYISIFLLRRIKKRNHWSRSPCDINWRLGCLVLNEKENKKSERMKRNALPSDVSFLI